MANTNVTMRIDENLKAQLQELMSNLGMDMTTFFTLAAKQALPFQPSMNAKPNMETLKAMAEVEYLMDHKENRKTYTDVDEMMEDLLS